MQTKSAALQRQLNLVALGVVLAVSLLFIPACTHSNEPFQTSEKPIAPQEQSWHLIETFEGDPSLYTQGLELTPEGNLLVSDGLYNDSGIGYLSPGSYRQVHTLPEYAFGEGLTQTPHEIVQLTWREGIAYRYDRKTLDLVGQFQYEGEGWGIAYDPTADVLYHSDGSNQIHIRNPVTFELISTQALQHDMLNELEVVGDILLANRYQTNQVVVYKIKNSEFEYLTTYDFSDLVEPLRQDNPDMDVLNGIAHISDNRFYITGKRFPVYWEVELSISSS